MGCRIIKGKHWYGGPRVEIMYCSTSEWAFGPVMQEGEGEQFISFLREITGLDPRNIEQCKLESLYYRFRARRAVKVKA